MCMHRLGNLTYIASEWMMPQLMAYYQKVSHFLPFVRINMVHTGPCDITVVNDHDQAVPETLLVDGNWYFHASPGSPFKVKLRFLPFIKDNTYGIGRFITVVMKLDGVSVGYTKQVSLHTDKETSFLFDGFIKSNKQ